MEDEKIVELYMSRDESAVRQTQLKYGAALASLAYRVVDDLQTAEECVNDALLCAWNTIPPHDPAGYLYAYLGRITRHIAIDRVRKEDAEKRSALICELSDEICGSLPSSESAGDALEGKELAEEISSFLKGCSKVRRGIFIRRYWYYDTICEISARFGISKSKVKTELFRARQELRSYLEKRGYDI